MIDVHIDGQVFAEVPRGGISRAWQHLIARLPYHGCRVHLYLPTDADRDIQFDSHVSIADYPRRRRWHPGRVFDPLTDQHYRRRLHKMWSRLTRGIFHSTHFTTDSGLAIPQVVTVHDLFHERLPDCFPPAQLRPFCDRRRACIESADFIICTSDATLGDVNKTYGPLACPYKVVWFAVDPVFLRSDHRTSPISEPLADAESPFILYLGTRYPYKNFPGLLAGFASWAKRHTYQLLVLGPEATPSELSLIRAFDLTGKVQFRSANDQQLALAYRLATAVVIPSLSEGFGLPVWESMASGTPVVCARVGSLPEVGGEAPIYFDLGPPHNLATALEEAVSIPKDSERMAKGYVRATSRTWDDVVDDYVASYRQLMG